MTFNLIATKRDILGKKTKVLRKKGFIPAEIYGHTIKNIHVSVPERDFVKTFKEAGEHAIINLAIDEGKNISVLVSDVQYNTLSEKFLAVDFHKINMDEKISAQIPIILVGEAPAVKAGCIILHTLHELHIECLPGNIPNEFKVDISRIQNPGDGVTVADLTIGEDIKPLINTNTVIVTAQEKKIKMEEPAPETTAQTTETPTEEETKKETLEEKS